MALSNLPLQLYLIEMSFFKFILVITKLNFSIMGKTSQSIWTIVLNVIKYAATLALGIIGGSQIG